VRLANSAEPAGTSSTSTTRTVSAGGLAGRGAAWYTRLLSRQRDGRDRVYVALSATQNAASTCPA
jgi:hypothetical protein